MSYNVDLPDERYIEVIPSSASYADAARTLNVSYMTLRLAAKRLNLTTKQGVRNHGVGVAADANYVRELYLSNKCAISSSALKLLLLKTGIKEHRCESCGLTTWLDAPIPLELHHINGDHNDNLEENLMVVCPTCHAYITYKARDKASAKRKKEIEKQEAAELKAYYDKHGWPPELIRSSKLHCTAEELIQLFNKYGSFREVGKALGVTYNTVRKRCKKLGILDIVVPLAYANRAMITKKSQKPLTDEQRRIRSELRHKEHNTGSPMAKIGQYDMAGNLLNVYDYPYQISDAGFNASHVRECCKGKRKSHKSYLWRFI